MESGEKKRDREGRGGERRGEMIRERKEEEGEEDNVKVGGMIEIGKDEGGENN